ncbi:MAG: hypothetical protein AAGM67_07890, partial [Bacteroidota bacterium]
MTHLSDLGMWNFCQTCLQEVISEAFQMPNLTIENAEIYVPIDGDFQKDWTPLVTVLEQKLLKLASSDFPIISLWLGDGLSYRFY